MSPNFLPIDKTRDLEYNVGSTYSTTTVDTCVICQDRIRVHVERKREREMSHDTMRWLGQLTFSKLIVSRYGTYRAVHLYCTQKYTFAQLYTRSYQFFVRR